MTEKTSNLPKIIEDRSQSEALNLETAQHIDKEIIDISSIINALQNASNLGPSPHVVLMQPREKIGKL